MIVRRAEGLVEDLEVRERKNGTPARIRVPSLSVSRRLSAPTPHAQSTHNGVRSAAAAGEMRRAKAAESIE